MNLLLIIKIISILFLVVYFFGIFIAFVLEYIAGGLFRKYQKEIQDLKSRNISPAIFHIKLFRIENDYRKNCEKIGFYRHFILKSMLLNRKFIENKKYLSLRIS